MADGDLGDALKRAGSKELRQALERSQQLADAERRARKDPRLNWRGPWETKKKYERGDVVYHDGSSWRALADHKGSEPPSPLWEYVAKKGEKGPPGPTGPAGTGIVGPAGSAGAQGPPGPPGNDLEFEDEGVPLGPAITVDFVGTGVTAAIAGGVATITIPGGVTSFDGRTGAVVPLQADYDGFFLTPAEGNAAYAPIGEPIAAAHIIDILDAHDASAVSFVPTGTIAATDVQAAIVEVASEGPGLAPVQSVFGRTGAVTALAADYDGFFLTPAEGNAAYQPIGSFTAGSVLFSGGGSTIAQDNANLFWDDTNNKLQVGDRTAYGGIGNILAALAQTQIVTKDSDATQGGVGLFGSVPRLIVASDSGPISPALHSYRSKGTLAAPTLVTSNMRLFTITANSILDNAGATGQSAFIFIRADADHAVGDTPGHILLGTTPVGAVAAVERLRITGVGEVLIGTTATLDSGVKFQVVGAASEKTAIFRANATTPGNIIELQDSAGTSLFAIPPTAFTQGSVPFFGASGLLAQDNANLFWDDTLKRLGIGTNTFGSGIEIYPGAYRIQTYGGSLNLNPVGNVVAIGAGLTVVGSYSGYDDELAFVSAGAGGEVAISTYRTGSPVLTFDHRATSNTGSFRWRNGSGAGTTVATLTTDFSLASGVFYIAGTQVVGAQGAAVADTTDVSDTATQLNALLARLRTHGLIAT